MLIPKHIFKIVAATSKDNTRYAINGVLGERHEQGRCAAVATDGRRLLKATWDDAEARKRHPAPKGHATNPKPGFSAIIPPDDWHQVDKNTPKNAPYHSLRDSLLDELSATPTHADFVADTTTGPIEIRTGLIDGKFPDYEQVIPQYNEGEDAIAYTVDPHMLANTLKTLADVADLERGQAVRLIVPTDVTKPLVISTSAPHEPQVLAVQMPRRPAK